MSALDELLNRWRKSPDAGATIALCSHLGVSQRRDLICEVGAAAQKRYSRNYDVMLAVGRMYLDVGMLAEAQVALSQAGQSGGQAKAKAPPERQLSSSLHREELTTSDFEEVEAAPMLRRAVTDSNADEVTEPRADSAAPARTQRQDAPLPSFEPSASVWGPEPPTVPGRISYPKSVPGYGSEPSKVVVPQAPDPRRAEPPQAALILEHLARVGVFERSGGVKPAWERPPHEKTRGAWVLVLATVLFVGGGGAGYYYAEEFKQEQLAQATQLNEEVARSLSSGSLDQIRSTDDKLERSFELNSLSQEAARLWLQNRLLHVLLAPGETRGLDSATHRAKRVGVQESQYAFGKVAGFFAEGDIAGAAALLPRWDKPAGKDAYYQLAGGAVLERAGDLRAIERYEAARALDKKLLVADMLLARLALLELRPKEGLIVIEELKRKGGEPASVQALQALHWAVNPDRPAELPAALQIDKQAEASLPVPLRPVVFAIEALEAIGAGDYEKASRAIAAGLERSLTPAMATRLGFLAIQADNEKLARTAALRALSFSAIYPKARVLAARVALLGGRFEEAKKAIEQLEPSSKDVAIVRAVVAYETLDGSALEATVENFGDEQQRPELEALLAAPAVLAGHDYPDEPALKRMSEPTVPWGQLVSMDAALASGRLDLATQLAQAWPKDVVRPVYSLRLSRLARYRGESDAALKHSERALSTPTTASVIERTLSLLAGEDVRAARRVVAQYPALLGASAGWLNIVIDAASGKEAQAAASAAAKEFPPQAAPLSLRLLAARALAVAKDKRAKDAVRLMQRVARTHPETAALAALL